MWIDFLKPFKDKFPFIPYHVVLLHGNVDDLFFKNIQSGEQFIHDYIIMNAHGYFDNIYTVDPISPLTKVSLNNKTKSDSSHIVATNQRSVLMNSKDDNGFDMTKILVEITKILQTLSSRNLIIIDYIEKLCPAQAISEFDRLHPVNIMKWIRNPLLHRSKNLAVLICRNWNQLSAEIKQLQIHIVEVCLPERKTHESYLRYIIHYLKEVDDGCTNFQ